METVHNSGHVCPYCHAFMYGHMNKDNIEAICPQCGFSFKGGYSTELLYQGNWGDWFSSEEECYEAGQVPVYSIINLM